MNISYGYCHRLLPLLFAVLVLMFSQAAAAAVGNGQLVQDGDSVGDSQASPQSLATALLPGASPVLTEAALGSGTDPELSCQRWRGGLVRFNSTPLAASGPRRDIGQTLPSASCVWVLAHVRLQI